MVVARKLSSAITRGPTTPVGNRPIPTVSPVSSTATRGSGTGRTVKNNQNLSDLKSALARRTLSKQGQAQGPAYDPTKQQRDFQPYGVGKPRYGGGRSAPNVGPVTGKEGYKERDLTQRVYKARAMKALKQKKSGRVVPQATFNRGSVT